MFGRKRNTCAYWDCNKRIPDDEMLCPEHYQAYLNGTIDRCPKCGRFKEKEHRLCLDCYFDIPVPQHHATVNIPAPREMPEVKYEKVKADEYLRPGRFYVYILQFGLEDLYIGHVDNMFGIQRRFAEWRKRKHENINPVEKPRLQYLETMPTRKGAELRASELKELLKSNPDQVRQMIDDFYRKMRELGVKDYFA